MRPNMQRYMLHTNNMANGHHFKQIVGFKSLHLAASGEEQTSA